MGLLALAAIITILVVLRLLYKSSKVELNFEMPKLMVQSAVAGVVKAIRKTPTHISESPPEPLTDIGAAVRETPLC